MASSGKFDAVLLAVASGSTVRDAATAHGVALRTAYRWAAGDDFRRQVSEIRTAAVGLAVGRLSDLAVRAADTLAGCLDSDDDGARIRAAVAILDRFGKLSESVDLRERVEALEKLRATK